MPPIERALVLIVGLALAGCSQRTGIADLQAVYGPEGAVFEQRTFNIDLNGDGRPERLMLLSNADRGLGLLPNDAAELSQGVGVDAFAVFDGRRPNIAVIYQYPCYDGYPLRLDDVDGQHVLVSDSGRDRVQHVWGWWRYSDGWSVDAWEARARSWQDDRQTYGDWRRTRLVSVFVGK